MNKGSISLAFFAMMFSTVLHAQQIQLPVARNIQEAVDKGTRTMNGKPGEKYWQNRASYDLKINFNPDTRLVSGTVDITYINNSPDVLHSVVFKLYTDLYKGGAMRSMPIEERDISKGMAIEKILVNNKQQDVGKATIEGTNMIVPVDAVAPSQQVHFSITYSYILNAGSHIRTGAIEDGAYFIAYSFPRIAVYDDIDGWNMAEYLGTYEFYNDFCDFDVAVTVPGGYAVWGTGDLVNCNEVYTAKICDRLKAAETGDNFVNVIEEADLNSNNVTQEHDLNTFRFQAKNVTDFAFATSNHYIWKSTSLVVDSSTGRRTRVDAVFNPAHKDYYDVVKEAQKTVEYMSYRFPKWPYPYPHETVFDGLDKMEYPMMVNDVPQEGALASFSLGSHEIFHTMFPFYMGINETKYGWMDEGWATIGEWLLTPMYLPGVTDSFAVDGYEAAAGTEIDLPIMTPSTQMQGIYYEDASAFAINSYPKPGLGYLYVKDLLGDELFFKGLHYYINTWHGKHPIPYDFFNCMNIGSGKNLDWFWKIWFFDQGYPDLGIASVNPAKKQVIVTSKGSKPVPVDVTVYFNDNTTEQIHRSVAVWEKGAKTITLNYTSTKPVSKVELGNYFDADTNSADNLWMNK
ncbi:MAG TPA: M1 family metallopeptidase [Panacibacter sp.]|nr:M1 family metallopeptidase [Panacibacter sp.]HNP43501.1 M1 family metallopeptidase [Panacibacter sp.]